MRSKRRLACEREIKSFGLCSAIFTGTTVLLNAWSFPGDAYASKTSLRDLSDVFFNFIQTAVPFGFFNGDTEVKYTPPEEMSKASSNFDVKKMPSPVWCSGSVVNLPFASSSAEYLSLENFIAR